MEFYLTEGCIVFEVDRSSFVVMICIFCSYFKTMSRRKKVLFVCDTDSLHHLFVLIMTWLQAVFNKL